MPLPRKLLGDDEDIVVEMRPHWVFFVGPLIVAAVAVVVVGVILVALGKHADAWVTYFFLALAAIPVLWFVGRLLRWRNYIIALTTTRIIVRRGVFERNTLQLRLQRVTEVNTSQALWERALGTGRLILDVQGDDDSLVIEDVSKPLVFQRVVNGQIDALVDRHRTDLYTGGAGGDEPPRREAPHPDRSNDTPPLGVPYAGDDATRPDLRVVPPGPPVAAAPPAAPGGATQGQIRDRLIELDDLRQRGILSEEEFAAKKAQLLDRI
ncbi:MAG: PH domain-containing protein [Acidimicrobiales bacterium]